ncbi:FAD-dependent monooxygenase [Amycolatopsis sp. cg5]|uniref:FAD-dependent monooxygenase n=1 Tax=Amycolatopsis sp. cg5 TaxID=3238802 RepID=UPI0035236236
MRETDVLVAGAGPAGLVTAAELALAGVRVTVLEKLPSTSEMAKGNGVQPRTFEVFDLRGITIGGERLPDAVGHFGGLPVPLDFSPWQTKHPRVGNVPQNRIEAALEARAVRDGAVVLRGHPVTAVSQDDDGVTVEAGSTFRARYLVAADGAHSAVRKLLGVPFPGSAGTYVATLTDIRLAAMSDLVPRRIAHFREITRQANGFWSMLTPFAEGRYRFVFGKIGEQAERDTPVTFDEVENALKALYGNETSLAELCVASRFSDATRQLERYRHGRILFAGDAAHIHPPLGAQGLNLGIQDAFNLGWKLAEAVHGDPSRLDSYHDERHPVAAEVLRHTAAQRVFTAPSLTQDVLALREIFTEMFRRPDANRYLTGLLSGLDLRYPTACRVPDLDLVTDDGPVSLSTLLHPGRWLRLDLGSHDVPDDGIKTVRAKTSGEYDGELLLIRPDGYLELASPHH